jgi:hypothetical protein
MPTNRRVFTSIYCKIYTDNFSNEMVDRMATGAEIYDFLLKDAGQCFDTDDEQIPGDLNIWYLGCCEKFGHLQLDDRKWRWSFGESSFDTVQEFAAALLFDSLICPVQYQRLVSKIEEGRLIDNIYRIRDYLICKREGIAWEKDPDASKFREAIKQRVAAARRYMQGRGYRFCQS